MIGNLSEPRIGRVYREIPPRDEHMKLEDLRRRLVHRGSRRPLAGRARRPRGGLIQPSLGPRRILEERQKFDPAGHYARPGVLRLVLDDRRQACSRGPRMGRTESLRSGRLLLSAALIAAAGCVGAGAAPLAGMTDAALEQRAVDALREFFGSDTPPPRAVAVTRWRDDLFASYSYFPVGAARDDMRGLRAA